jgi:hypothetical protein
VRLHTGQDYAGRVLRAVKRPEAKFEKVNTIATLNLPALGEERPLHRLRARRLAKGSASILPRRPSRKWRRHP